MINELWLNLPIKDVNVSREFFTKLGFKFNPHYGNGPDNICLLVGDKNVVVMLFKEGRFEGFTNHKIADTKAVSEVLISIGAETPEDVDDLARKAEEAGGNVFAKPADIQGWMYGCGFADPDGHRWNVLYMDMNKMPK